MTSSAVSRSMNSSNNGALQAPPPPPALNPEADPAEWRRWKRLFEAYVVLTKLATKDAAEREATIVTILGVGAMDLYDSLPFANDEERQEVKAVLGYLEQHFLGRRNTIYERYLFSTRQQEEGETFQHYLAALRKHAAHCDFENITPNQILRDKLVYGIRDEQVRKMLLARKKLTLDECIEECRSAQDTSQRVEVMRRGAEEKGLREALGSADNVIAVRQRSDMCGKVTKN